MECYSSEAVKNKMKNKLIFNVLSNSISKLYNSNENTKILSIAFWKCHIQWYKIIKQIKFMMCKIISSRVIG